MESHGPRAPLERRLAAALGIAATAALVGLSLAAIRIAVRPHTPKMSFGYHRIEVLAAFVNAVLLAAIASSLLVAIYGRIGQPRPVQGSTMFAVGLAGLAANLAIVALLGPSARRNINIRGAFLHAYGD